MFDTIFKFLTLLFLCSQVVFASEWVVLDGEAMGTTIHTEVWHEDQAIAEQMAQEVMAIMNSVDQLMSPYIESSELALLNREASKQPVKVSEDLYYVIERSSYYSMLTHGAFDITFASVGYLYDYRGAQRPDEDELKSQLKGISYQNIVLDENMHSVYFKQPNL